MHSLLHLIPKKRAPTLDNLRSLCLNEITRKLMAAIIIKRAYRTWEYLQLLHLHQHAYRRDMSTGNLRNLIKDSAENDTWDIKRL